MDLIQALIVVRELANQNVLEESQAIDYDLIEERHLQQEAVSVVDEYLKLLRGSSS